jgi:hypothetical protein
MLYYSKTKMIVTEIEQLQLILNLGIASAKMRKINIEQEKGLFVLRPQIHIILAGDRGYCKSSIINEVAQHFEIRPTMETTVASFVGTIDTDTKQFQKGIAWESRNKILPLDEFEFTDRSFRPHPMINVFLSLMEGEQYYKRSIGVMNKFNLEEKDGDLFYKINKGVVEIKTNFAFLIGTMDKLNFVNVKLQAFKSRCIPIIWKPTWDTLRNVAKGYKFFEYKELRHTKRKEVVIKKKDYEVIRQYVEAKTNNPELYLRTLGDCCRVFAIIGKHVEQYYDLIIQIKSEK